MTVTRAELLEVVYRYYPRGLARHDSRCDDTEEHRRLVEAARRGVAEYPTWQAMARRLGDRYRLQDESLHLLSGGIDPAYSARIYLGERTLGVHVSLLGPYYGVHRTGAADDEAAANEIAQEIEATYPGYQPIPLELGDEVVPDAAVDVSSPSGEATIHVCLFSIVWDWSSPEPARPTPGTPPTRTPPAHGNGTEARILPRAAPRVQLAQSLHARAARVRLLRRHAFAVAWFANTVTCRGCVFAGLMEPALAPHLAPYPQPPGLRAALRWYRALMGPLPESGAVNLDIPPRAAPRPPRFKRRDA